MVSLSNHEAVLPAANPHQLFAVKAFAPILIVFPVRKDWELWR